MTDDILKDLLSDILQQQATILKVVSDLQKQHEKVQLETTNTTTHAPVVDDGFILFANNFFSELNKGVKQLKVLSDKIPLEVKSVKYEETKVVLFSKKYNEGNYGAKDLLKTLYIFFGVCFGLFLLAKYIPSYLGSKDENIAYRDTLHWYYFKSDTKNREALLKTLHQFRKGDTLYVNELNRYIKNAKILKHE